MATTGKTFSHFLAKLTPSTGVEPAAELNNIMEQCRRDPKAAAWFATLTACDKFQRAGNSICIIFHQPDKSARVEAIVARILTQEDHRSPPENAEVRKFYARWRDRSTYWWPLGGSANSEKICDVVQTEFASLDEIPGQSWDKKKGGTVTFQGQNIFVGWNFADGFEPLKWLRTLPGNRPGHA